MATPLSKGQNAALTAADLLISVQVGAAADLSALLVTDTGKVRSDADFVFFNQPSGPGVRLVPGSAGQPSSLAVSTAAVPADIAKVRAVITLDTPGSTFGSLPAPTVKIASNTATYRRMADAIDLDAGPVLEGAETVEEAGERIFAALLRHASGERTKGEIEGMGESGFAPWPIGVCS